MVRVFPTQPRPVYSCRSFVPCRAPLATWRELVPPLRVVVAVSAVAVGQREHQLVLARGEPLEPPTTVVDEPQGEPARVHQVGLGRVHGTGEDGVLDRALPHELDQVHASTSAPSEAVETRTFGGRRFGHLLRMTMLGTDVDAPAGAHAHVPHLVEVTYGDGGQSVRELECLTCAATWFE